MSVYGLFGRERGLTGRGGPPGASISLNVITPTLGLALGFAAALPIVDGLGWRVVAAMFDRERLVTGKRTWQLHRAARAWPAGTLGGHPGSGGEAFIIGHAMTAW
jgi:hypothetical protein